LGLLFSSEVYKTDDNPLNTGACLIFLIYYSDNPTLVFDFLGLGVIFF